MCRQQTACQQLASHWCHESYTKNSAVPESDKKTYTEQQVDNRCLLLLCLCHMQMTSQDFCPRYYNDPHVAKWYSTVVENNQIGVELSRVGTNGKEAIDTKTPY